MTQTGNGNRVKDLRTAMDKLAQIRDEQRLKIHLAKADARDEWLKVESKWDKLQERFRDAQDVAEEAGHEVWAGFEHLMDEVRDGYDRVRRAL